MNKKGFTLVELLATLVVLSLVLGISIFGIFSTLENAKKKTEREFLTQLSNSVETYIDLCLSGMAKNTNSCNYIMRSIPQDVQYAIGKISKSYDDNVPVYKDSISVKINFYNIVNNENILVRNDFINPVNSKDCYEGATIDFYRDGDYVYYYKIVLPACLKYNGNIIHNFPDSFFPNNQNELTLGYIAPPNGESGKENPNGGGKPNGNSLIEQEDAIIPNDEIDSGNYEEYVGGKTKHNNNLEESNDNLEGEEVIISEGRVAQERERVENTQ